MTYLFISSIDTDLRSVDADSPEPFGNETLGNKTSVFCLTKPGNMRSRGDSDLSTVDTMVVLLEVLLLQGHRKLSSKTPDSK